MDGLAKTEEKCGLVRCGRDGLGKLVRSNPAMLQEGRGRQVQGLQLCPAARAVGCLWSQTRTTIEELRVPWFTHSLANQALSGHMDQPWRPP